LQTIFETNVDSSKKTAAEIMSMKRKLRAQHQQAQQLATEVSGKAKLDESEDGPAIVGQVEDEPDEAIEASSKKQKSFKDPNFYLEPLPSNLHSEAGYCYFVVILTARLAVHESNSMNSRDIVLDLGGDDAHTITHDKSVRKWDRKRKKFVWVKGGVDVNDRKAMKNESGRKIKEADKGKM
jgi:hypothetical protein